jgi:POT family proton-dependent oligopeptide transporter
METDDLHSVPEHLATARESAKQRHPRGLATLFFTEMWERFSYYGMRALLVLFMVDAVRGGMGMDDKTAAAIYGLYTAAVYLMSLPGGWFADRVAGAQRTVWIGGCIIALGHFTLAVPWTQTFYLGLIFVVVGSGTLKPNMSGLVAELYPEGGARRDAGFTIFYMGVNLGAALGPLVCGWLAKAYGWHYGFGAAGVGMVLGLIQFRLSRSWLGSIGTTPSNPAPIHPAQRAALFGSIAVVAILTVLGLTGLIHFNPVSIAHAMTYMLLGIGLAFFLSVFLLAELTADEKKRVGMIIVLFLSSALFWAGFEQAGSSFNLFAERYTDRVWIGFEFPAEWFQTLGPIFIITLAPVFASLWVALGRRKLDPSIPVKFGLGLLLLAAGFIIMAGAAKTVASGEKAWPAWLIATYLVHTFGELCLSPVGLSSVTKLAPRKLVGQMMGAWFLATSLGNLIAGLLAGNFDPNSTQLWPAIYLQIVIPPAAAGLLLIIFSRPLCRLIAGAQ